MNRKGSRLRHGIGKDGGGTRKAMEAKQRSDAKFAENLYKKERAKK
jgi:hypothetical protein